MSNLAVFFFSSFFFFFRKPSEFALVQVAGPSLSEPDRFWHHINRTSKWLNKYQHKNHNSCQTLEKRIVLVFTFAFLGSVPISVPLRESSGSISHSCCCWWLFCFECDVLSPFVDENSSVRVCSWFGDENAVYCQAKGRVLWNTPWHLSNEPTSLKYFHQCCRCSQGTASNWLLFIPGLISVLLSWIT